MNQATAITKKASITQIISQLILGIQGWKIIGNFPNLPKYLVIGAPHTSNWDFVYTLLLKGAMRINLKWVGKDSIFRWPFGRMMRWMGGIPVNRKFSNRFVDQVVALFNQNDEMIIAISPEGTRSKSNYWRSGFYYMAVGANVPIVMVAIDYSKKILEISSTFFPSGELEADFPFIQSFFDGRVGKYPDEQGLISLRPQ